MALLKQQTTASTKNKKCIVTGFKIRSSYNDFTLESFNMHKFKRLTLFKIESGHKVS